MNSVLSICVLTAVVSTAIPVEGVGFFTRKSSQQIIIHSLIMLRFCDDNNIHNLQFYIFSIGATGWGYGEDNGIINLKEE